jgi:polysaccharide deacetylase 2 family uncharacterized protein YibQ
MLRGKIENFIFLAMLHKISLKVLIGTAAFLFAVLLGTGLVIGKKNTKQEPSSLEPKQEASKSEALFLNENLKKALNVHNEITLPSSKTDTGTASEIWLVPNGISIPNYMLRASREIERHNGKIHWMREIKNGRALIKYEGEQGVYPLLEIRVIDTLWQPNSSKLAVVLAAKEQNKILRNKPEILEKLGYAYNLLIPSSRPELLEAGKKANANIIPWIPMESRIEMVYLAEKKNQIPIGITNEKELAKKLYEQLRKFDHANGFAAFYGEDFLIHPASVGVLEKVLREKNLWFWDLSKNGTASLLSPEECVKKDIRCRRNNLDIYEEFNEQVNKALRMARKNGKAILLFELTEKNIDLLEKLPDMAEKQGTGLVHAGEVF